MNHIRTWVRAHRHELILTGIVAVGLWFRFTDLYRWIWYLTYDSSRDMLVARHIAEFGDWLWRGPLAAASGGRIFNSPVYYYLVALFWWVVRDPFLVMALWALLSSALVLIAYKIGEQLWDRTAGYILALLFAISLPLIIAARQLWQPYMLPLPVALYLLFMTKRRQTVFDLSLAALFLMLPLHFHYSSAVLIPAGTIWLVWRAWESARRHRSVWHVVWPLGVMGYVIMLLAVLTYRTSFFDQVGFFPGHAGKYLTQAGQNLLLTGGQLTYYLWRVNEALWPLAIVLTFALMAFLGRPEDGHPMRRNMMAWMALMAASGIALVVLFGLVIDYYLLPVIPLLLVLVGMGLRQLIAVHKPVGVLAAVAVMAALTINAGAVLAGWRESANVYTEATVVSRKIAEDYAIISTAEQRKNNGEAVPAFALAMFTTGPYLSYDGWGTSAFWMLLEQYYRTRLVRLVEYGPNFVPIVQTPEYFYVICDHVDHMEEDRFCLDKFRSTREYVSESYARLYFSRRLSLWRFSIVGDKPPGNMYNTVFVPKGVTLPPQE